jgi:hypothetical protein
MNALGSLPHTYRTEIYVCRQMANSVPTGGRMRDEEEETGEREKGKGKRESVVFPFPLSSDVNPHVCPFDFRNFKSDASAG